MKKLDCSFNKDLPLNINKNINLEVTFMNGKIASTENLAVAIWDELKPSVEKEGALLHSIKIKETENNSIEYYG